MPRPPITELGGNPFKPFARERIESSIDLPKLYAAIDRDPAIVGAGVVYVDTHYNAITLRAFQPICSVLPKRLVLQELPRAVTAEQYLEQQVKDPRQSRLFSNIRSTGLACAGAAGGLILMLSGGAIIVFTAGTSMIISIANAAAVGASAIQCFIGAYRIKLELQNPEDNDAFESQIWFQIISPLLDTVALLGIASASLSTLRYLQIRKRATGLGWFASSRNLSRQQRSNLMTEILSIKHPSLTYKQLKLKQRIGLLPKRFTPTQLRSATAAMIGESINSGIGIIGSGMIENLAVTLIEDVGE